MADASSTTGYEPKDRFVEDTSFLVKPMFFHKPLRLPMGFTEYAGFHHCTYRREKQVPTDHEFITLSEKNQCPVHLTFEKVQGSLPQCSHKKESRVKTHFPDRDDISSGHETVQGKGETFFRFSHPEEATRLVFEEQRDHLLAEAKSEILKQECKVDLPNSHSHS